MKRFVTFPALASALALACGCAGSNGPRLARSYPRDHFLPGGVFTLAEGRVSHGPPFAISVERYRFQGRLHTDLQAQIEPHAKPTGEAGSFSPSSHAPFEWTTEEGCSARVTWSVVYGLLREGERGFLVLGRHRYALRTAPIPARFHLRGEVGYAALPRSPSRVLVRDDAGRVVQDDELGRPERCTPGESGSTMVLRRKS